MSPLVLAQARQRFPEEAEAYPSAGFPGREPTLPVLLVEHHLPLAKPLLRGLAEEGIVAHLALNDAEGDARVRAISYAAAVVDWNIPQKGGAALVRGWRRAGLAVPVLIFLASASEDDRREGAAAGVDDFLPLPFSIAELVARLQVWVKPLGGPPPVAAPLNFDGRLARP